MGTETLLPNGEKIRRAIKWISEITLEHPDWDRKKIVCEAEQRFDLSPKDCDFLNRHLAQNTSPCGQDQSKPSP